MFPLGNAPNWQRLIDGIKACCEDPDMDVVVACHDKEERLVVHARGESVSIPYREFSDCLFWSIAIARIGQAVDRALNAKEAANEI